MATAVKPAHELNATSVQARRSVSLDVLRSAAVLMVLFRHVENIPDSAIYQPLVILRRGGWAGVDLFFALSGFLIAGLLFKEQKQHGTIAFRRFFIRRGLRIYPAFYFFLFSTTVALALGTSRASFSNLLPEVFFYQNYKFGLWGATWSLAVEEHFYIFLPFVLFLLGKRGGSNPFWLLPGVYLLIAVACLSLRMYNALNYEFDYMRHLVPTHVRIDSLMMGVLVSYAYHYKRPLFERIKARLKYVGWLIAALAFAPAFLLTLEQSRYIASLGFTVLAVGACVLLIASSDARPNNRVAKSFAFIGSRSYSIYLWHMPMAGWSSLLMSKLFHIENWLVVTLVYLIGSILLGLVMHSLIEYPVSKFRERLFPARVVL
jgi:peptidoglycan/LPS O-acetylase OafA/YrhL